MYGSTFGGISGVLHMLAKRPAVTLAVAIVALTGVIAVPILVPIPKAPVALIAQTSSVQKAIQSGTQVAGTCPVGKVTNVCKAVLDNAAINLADNDNYILIVTGPNAVTIGHYLTSGEAKLRIPSKLVVTKPDTSDINRILLAPAGSQ